MKTKNKLVARSIGIKKEAKNAMLKNTLLQWILKKILENQTFQRIAKFTMVDFHEMNFMNGIVIFVKTDEMNNMLKSASH